MPYTSRSPRPAAGLPARRYARLVAALLLLALAACDTVGLAPAPIVLPEKEVTFRFEFSGETLLAGDAIVSVDAEDLAAALRADGFTKAEVLGAEVVAAEIERIQPTGSTLSSFLDEVTLFLEAGAATAAVAEAATLPAARDAALEVLKGDVAGIVTAPSFRAVLQATGAQVTPAEQYILEATVVLEVEVEGV